MPRRILTLALLGLAAVAAFAAPRLLPALRPADPIPEVQPVVVVQPEALPLVPEPPTIPERRDPRPPTTREPRRTIPEVQEQRPITHGPMIPELDEPRAPVVQLPVDPPPLGMPDGCPACGRG